MTVEISGK